MGDKETEPPPNAVPASTFDLMKSWADELGVDWDEVLRKADIERTTRWRMGKGQASQATAKKIRDVLEEISRKRGHEGDASLLVARVTQWAELGARLAQLDREKFLAFYERVRLVVDGEEAMLAIRNPLPPRDDT